MQRVLLRLRNSIPRLRRLRPQVPTLLLAGAWVAAPMAAQPTDIVDERIEVVEARALIELPRLGKKVRELQPADFVVTEGGLQRTVTAVRPLDLASEPWTVLVYFDPLLAGPRTVELAASTLAEHAAELVHLGPTQVVTSAPLTQQWIAPTRDAAALAEALRALGQSRIGRDGLATLRRAQGEEPADLLEEESFFLRERADALLLEAATGCDLRPCLLVLVSEGFDTLPEQFYPKDVIERADPPHERIAGEMAQLLAGFGWTVLSLPLAPAGERETFEGEEGPGTDYYAWKRESGGVQMPRPRKPGNRLSGLPTNALDVFLQARLQTLREWSAASVGAALRVPEQLPSELGRLRNRLWVVYQSDARAPAVQSLEVRLAAMSPFQDSRRTEEALGFAPEEETLRAPSYSATSIPLALSDARGRALAFGKRLSGDLGVRIARSGEQPIGVTWSEVDDTHTVRVSVFDEEGELTHRAETQSGEANHRLLLDVETTGWVIVEDLLSREWGAIELAGGETLLD